MHGVTVRYCVASILVSNAVFYPVTIDTVWSGDDDDDDDDEVMLNDNEVYRQLCAGSSLA